MLLNAVRYGIPAVLAVIGVLFLAFGSEDTRYDMFGMSVGAAFAVLIFSLLLRIGATSDRDREQEEAARRYLDRHGRWPDDD